MCDGLYRINLNLKLTKILITLQSHARLKRNFNYKKSSIIRHKCLGHISNKRIKRFVKNNILENLGNIDFDICIYYIKRKQTKHIKNTL